MRSPILNKLALTLWACGLSATAMAAPGDTVVRCSNAWNSAIYMSETLGGVTQLDRIDAREFPETPLVVTGFSDIRTLATGSMVRDDGRPATTTKYTALIKVARADGQAITKPALGGDLDGNGFSDQVICMKIVEQ